MIKLVALKPNKSKLDFTRFSTAARLGLKDAADAALKDFQATTATWQHQPTFTMKEQKDGILLGTDDEIWQMLDHGTRAHLIVARRAKRLRFASGFKPKTRPGFIGSQSGGSSGGPVFAQSVQHPGTTARGWSKLIAKKYRALLSRYVQARIRAAA